MRRDVRVGGNRNVLADPFIQLAYSGARDKCHCGLRRIILWDPAKRETLELLTNHLEFGATTIAGIYKERWQIEDSFKAFKHNLNVKTFVATSPNALLMQILTALIGMLVMRSLEFGSRFGGNRCRVW